MGWLKYSNEIPDPKTRRFQELNGIKGRLSTKSSILRMPDGLREPTNQTVGCQK